MTYMVPISDCLPQFHRAHEAMIKSLGGSHHIARTTILGREKGVNYWVIMAHNWQKLYNATPVGENGHWKYLDFESEQHYTLFVLKWGGGLT